MEIKKKDPLAKDLIPQSLREVLESATEKVAQWPEWKRKFRVTKYSK